jgi:PIN domain nuclease of toxin-antitoxin system
MKLLLDTHILIWAAQDKLSPDASAYILDEKTSFSLALPVCGKLL